MMGNYHVRFGGRERGVLFGGITLPTQCGTRAQGRGTVAERALGVSVRSGGARMAASAARLGPGFAAQNRPADADHSRTAQRADDASGGAPDASADARRALRRNPRRAPSRAVGQSAGDGRGDRRVYRSIGKRSALAAGRLRFIASAVTRVGRKAARRSDAHQPLAQIDGQRFAVGKHQRLRRAPQLHLVGIEIARQQVNQVARKERHYANTLVAVALRAGNFIGAQMERLAAHTDGDVVIFLDHADKEAGVVVFEEFAINDQNAIAVFERRHAQPSPFR